MHGGGGVLYFGHTTQYAELPWPGNKPVPSAVEAPSLNHQTTREVLNKNAAF